MPHKKISYYAGAGTISLVIALPPLLVSSLVYAYMCSIRRFPSTMLPCATSILAAASLSRYLAR